MRKQIVMPALAVSILVVLVLLAGAIRGLPAGWAAESASVKVELDAGRNANSIAYTITLINDSSTKVGPIYIAAAIPKGTRFVSVAQTPAGAWNSGVQGGNVIWMSDGIAARGQQGPFIYKVTATSPSIDAATAWVHWTVPSEGAASSPPTRADYQLIKLRGINPRDAIEKYPAGKVALTTTAGTGHNEEMIATSALPNVGVGDYVYFQGSDHDAMENKIVRWAWDLLERPLGSKATLENANTQMPRLLTDRVGRYLVHLAATNEKGEGVESAMTVHAGKYAGVSLCASCHDGSLADDMVSEWAKTGHSTKFEDAYDSYAPDRDYCIRCHTVGYNEQASSGGMADAARASGWNPLRDGSVLAWLKRAGKTIDDVKADPNMASKINVQCENCHGPGASEHTQAKSYNPGVCGQCHPQPQQWQYSKHAVVNPEMAANASCVRCHTGQGYVEVQIRGNDPIFPDAATPTKPANIPSLEQQSGVSCAACHDSHQFTFPHEGNYGLASDQLRVEGRVTATNGWSVDAGVAATCVKCHANNRTQATMAQFLAGNYVRATHENTQADVFFGKGYYDYGGALTTSNSAHTTLLKDYCVTCHMGANPKVGADTVLSVGGHSFNIEGEWKGKEVENVAVCAQCHTGATTFNRPATGDYDGDGKIEGVQDEVKGLLAALAQYLPKGADGNVLASGISNANTNEAQRKAMWNYFLVLRDGSDGVHNTSFTVQLLQKTYKQLTGRDVPGATLR